MNRTPIGQILVLREELGKVAAKANESPAIRRRAEILCAALDELIYLREKEHGANG